MEIHKGYCRTSDCSPFYLRCQTLNLCNDLRGGGQVLITILEDVDVVLDAHSSNLPVLIQDLGVDILTGLGVLQDGVHNEGTEIDLRVRLAACTE